MKTHITRILILGMAVVFTLACSLPGLFRPTPVDEPPGTEVAVPPELTATDDTSKAPDPTATDALIPPPDATATGVPPTVETTTPPPNAGQIAYRFQGNVWRYLIDSNEILPVTTDGVMGDHMNSYGWARFSPDGRYLAYNRGNASYILDLTNNDLTDISTNGQLFAWQGEDTQFYAVQGDFECPPIEDLDDQVLINFNILRLDLNNLPNPEFLANISGGLSFLQAISPDGEWASVVHCACYSECGGAGLYNLPTLSPVASPIDLNPGSIDFSPDSAQLTVSQWQMFGYIQSPLYVANSDFTGMVEVFSMPDVAPVNTQWSPDSAWIGFTGIAFAADEFTETDRCVHLVRPDGSENMTVECDFADFITWSPDGTQLLFSQVSGNQDVFFIYDLATGSSTPLPFQVEPYTTHSIDWGRHQ